MGFFKKAKDRFTDKFTDEVVREGNFSDELKEDDSFSDLNENEVLEETLDTSPESRSLSLADFNDNKGPTPKEILQSERVKETFTIDDDILFVDEELANQKFSEQAPIGYDIGEVDFFLSKVQKSIGVYVNLLRKRNEDVLKLATRISDLSVEINNLRFNAEMANGINIMTGGGEEDVLAVQLDEAKVEISNLKQELKKARELSSNYSGVESGEDSVNVDLRNELAAEKLQREKLQNEVKDLRATLMSIEEEYNINVIADDGSIEDSNSWAGGYDSYLQQRALQDSSNSLDSAASSTKDFELPDLDEDNSFENELPDLPKDNFEDFDNYENSDFTKNPYQSLGEFIEEGNTSEFLDYLNEDNEVQEFDFGNFDDKQ